MNSAASGLFLLLGLIVLVVLYFLPTIVGASRHKRNTGAIFVVNLFFGWSLLGWVIALVWALTTDAPAQVVIVNNPSERMP